MIFNVRSRGGSPLNQGSASIQSIVGGQAALTSYLVKAELFRKEKNRQDEPAGLSGFVPPGLFGRVKIRVRQSVNFSDQVGVVASV